MAAKTIFILAGIITVAVSRQYDRPTCSEIGKIKKTIVNEIMRTNYRFISTTVRLAFHDCIGGCDGCIDVDNPLNRGLSGIIEFLEGQYHHKFDKIVSRADFWQLAAISSIEYAVLRNNQMCNGRNCMMPTPEISFKWGRKNCGKSPYTALGRNIPNNTMSKADMFQFFWTEFGFNPNQTVAAMGAHTIGEMKRENSGYLGEFVQYQRLYFNSVYYRLLLGQDIWGVANKTRFLVHKNSFGEDRKFQHLLYKQTLGYSPRVGAMLPCDMQLAYDIEVDPINGFSCKADDCEHASTFALVEEYAKNGTKWMDDFRQVYGVITEKGYAPGSLGEI